MNVLVDSSSPQKMAGILFENGGFVDQKLDAARGYVEKTRKKYALAIPAVPLRSIPTINVKREPEKSVKSHHNDYGVEQKMANNKEGNVDTAEDSWKRDSEKLAAVIAEAKEYISSFNDTLNKRTTTGDSEQLLETVKSEKRARDKFSSESVMLRNVDQSLPEKRMKVENSVSKVVQEKKTSGLEIKCEDDEEEVCVLSPAEWNMLQVKKHKYPGAKTLTEKVETNPEKWCLKEFPGECNNVVKSDRIESVDFLDLSSDSEVTETKRGEEHGKNISMDLDEYVSVGEEEDDENAIIVYSGESSKAMFNSNNEPSYNEELINLEIVQHDQPQGLKVMEALKLFEARYTELLQAELRGESKVMYAYQEAASLLKAEGKWIAVEKHFGHIPGIEIGDEFRFRVELAIVGLHRQSISGIDYVILDGKKLATSVVNSGRYENEARALDVLIYSGQGGHRKLANNAADQKLEKGNLALVNSMEMGYPVRVTYKKNSPLTTKTLGTSAERNYVYVYDGLYKVNRFWQERDQNGKLVFKFELHRMPGQPRPRQTNDKSRKSKACAEICILDDISKGKENHPVRAINGVDEDRPPSFDYVTKMVYPPWYKPIEPDGCNCIDGCQDFEECPCVAKNGGEIPFNENGAIIRAKPRVHECGPLCKCPPSCMNRVTQHGPRHKLEIFKTKTRGWGVRSRTYISSGSFICEYVGELLEDTEADRVGNDEYLFDLCDSYYEETQGELGSKTRVDGFAIDALEQGNIGRFINHSCSPNLYAQEILFDHDDKRMPHIMFFATRNIPPLQELTYDYNYKMDRICDVNGNIKTKACCCGSRKCTGRLY